MFKTIEILKFEKIYERICQTHFPFGQISLRLFEEICNVLLEQVCDVERFSVSSKDLEAFGKCHENFYNPLYD